VAASASDNRVDLRRTRRSVGSDMAERCGSSSSSGQPPSRASSDDARFRLRCAGPGVGADVHPTSPVSSSWSSSARLPPAREFSSASLEIEASAARNTVPLQTGS
jgi:hypothetical protein